MAFCVSIQPGATVLTVMPYCAYSSATVLSRPIVDGRVALATTWWMAPSGSLAVAEPMCTKRPQPASFIAGSTAWSR